MFKRFYLISCMLLFIGGCADHIVEYTASVDEEIDVDNIAPTFSKIQTNIFNNSCATSGCHVSGGVNPDLSGNSYVNIVNKQSSTGIDYIEPNDPDGSYLLMKILGTNGISGSRMPLNDSPLSQSSIDSITDWINEGAKNN